MFNSIEDVKEAHKAAGGHWFDKDSMKFFNSIVYPELIQHPEGAYFISSERFDSGSPRLFTVRFASFDGSIATVGEFMGFGSKDNAWQWALGHKDGQEI
ncbi:MAG TPA: hypothetical protein VIY48_15780 [Candidatus Paceibacterota bacterium]